MISSYSLSYHWHEVATASDMYAFFCYTLQIEIKEVDGVCPSPSDMAEQVVTYLEEKGFLHE
jgi:hypothetical protein